MLFLALLAPLLLWGNLIQAGGIGNLVNEIIKQTFDSESKNKLPTKDFIKAYYGEISPEIINRYEVKLEAKKSKLQSKGKQLKPEDIRKSVEKAVKEIEKKIRKQMKVLEKTGSAKIGNARMYVLLPCLPHLGVHSQRYT